MKKIVPFKEVPAGAAFRALKPSFHRNWDWSRGCHAVQTADRSRPAWTRKVENNSTYVKVAPSHAHDIVSRKDAIFEVGMPCRLLELEIDISDLPDYAVLNAGKSIEEDK